MSKAHRYILTVVALKHRNCWQPCTDHTRVDSHFKSHFAKPNSSCCPNTIVRETASTFTTCRNEHSKKYTKKKKNLQDIKNTPNTSWIILSKGIINNEFLFHNSNCFSGVWENRLRVSQRLRKDTHHGLIKTRRRKRFISPSSCPITTYTLRIEITRNNRLLIHRHSRSFTDFSHRSCHDFRYDSIS